MINSAEMEWDSSMLLASSMQAQGQIVNDLALSDSDEEHHLDQVHFLNYLKNISKKTVFFSLFVIKKTRVTS